MMSREQRCYLGVDAGLTSVKAAAFDEQGRQVAVAKAPTPRTHRGGAAIEVDLQALWEAAARALIEVTAQLRARGIEPAGIGVTGHGNGLYPLDDALEPVRPGFPSTDGRAEGLIAGLSSSGSRHIRAVTGSVPWAAQPLPLLAWMAEHEPERYRRTRWLATCKDWLTSRLTGVLSADYSDASACGLVDLAARRYFAPAFELYGLPASDRERLAPLSRSDEVVGHVTRDAAAASGLAEGLPVVAGCMDCVAGSWSAGGRRRGDLTVIVGTWSINGVVARSDAGVPSIGMCALLPEPDAMLVMEVAPTSAANLEWLLRSVLPTVSTSPTQPFDLAASVPAGSDGLLYLPFLHGTGPIPSGSGSFLGLGASHGDGELIRAVLEGVAQFHRLQIERMVAAGVSVNPEGWLAGGGARSELWSQIFADVLGRPLFAQDTVELGSRGVAAMARSGAIGGEPWDPPGRRSVMPSSDRRVYERQARLFEEAMGALQPVWEAMAHDRWP